MPPETHEQRLGSYQQGQDREEIGDVELQTKVLLSPRRVKLGVGALGGKGPRGLVP